MKTFLGVMCLMLTSLITLSSGTSQAASPEIPSDPQAADWTPVSIGLRAANSTDRSIRLQIPPGWSVAPQVFQNARTLVDVEQGSGLEPTVYVQVFVEPRRDHADALEQIRDFVASVPADGREFMQIDGWPAAQLTRVEVQPQPSQGRPMRDPRMLKVEVYIAVGDDLVVVSGALPPTAPPGLVQRTVAIARSLGFTTASTASETDKELDWLRSTPEPGTLSPEAGAADESVIGMAELDSGAELGAVTGANERIDAAGRGELEIATSVDGIDVVVALQGRAFTSSNDGGSSFPNSGVIGAGNGDPSIARGQSGDFYIAWIDTNCGSNYQTFNVNNLAAQPFGYDCTGMSRSTDNGVSFQTNTVNPAVVCIGRAPAGGGPDPAGACFPDQEHIAADPVNAGAGGGDQIYSTWRNFNSANQDAGLVCSQDNGVNWTAPITLGANSFFPRITVGQDGFVYVAAYSGGNYRLWKFSSCANGLAVQAGFPVNVAARTPYDCPFAGHDRCDQNPSSQTAVVDQTDPNHIYYAFAQDAGTAGSDSVIVVLDSLDGGATWRPSVQANPGTGARRIMPWLCTTGGDAVLTWYEQRGTADATDHYGAVVGLNDSGNLVPKDSFVISEVPDNWCDTGWPCGTRFANGDTNTDNAAEACPNQPQLAGICGDGIAGTADSGTRCDFSDEAAIPGTYCPQAATSPSGNNELCLPGNGCPKYGDYNGNACAGGKLFAAWPSASAPDGVPPPNSATNTGVLFDVVNLDVVAVPVITVPSSVRFEDTCVGTTSYETLNVCNTGSANLQVDEITSDNADVAVTLPSSGFPVTISPDFCFPFEVTYTPSAAGTGTAELSIPTDDPDRPLVTMDVSVGAATAELVSTLQAGGVFGPVKVGDNRVLNLQVSNGSTTCPLEVTNLARTSGSADFEFAGLVGTTFPVTLPPGSNLDLPIRYTPSAFSPTQSAEFTLTTNDPPARTFTVTGSSPPPDVALTGNLEFGEVCPLSDLQKTVQICNLGELNTLQVSSVGLQGAGCGNFTIVDAPTTPFDVSHDFCVNVTARFSPAAVGVYDACNLVVASNDPDEPAVSLPLTGTAPPPDINVAIANSGNFGEVCKGDQRDLNLTLFNQGKCNLTITDISSDNALFVLPADTQYPLVLSPDADFNLPVRFQPEACSDAPVTGTITINSDSPGEESLDIDLSAVSPCPNLVIDPPDVTGLYAFPATVVDTSGTLGCSSERSVTLRNTGSCPLTISAIDASADDFAVTAPTQFPIELPPGEETLNVTLRFTPQSGGDPNYPTEVLGTLTVASDDPDAAGNAQLCGEGAVQSGMRILASDVSSGTPLPVAELDSLVIKSQGRNTPSPINLRFSDLPVDSDMVCGNPVSWHVNVESLPAVGTTGSNPRSSYAVTAQEGNLQATKSLNLGQCDFLEFQMQLVDSNSEQCLLKQKGESCDMDSECCSRNCKGPRGAMTCK